MADITQEDMEQHYKPDEVRRASCDDGSGVAGPALSDAMESASKQARMILGRAWPDPAAQTKLIENDECIKGDICDLAMHELTKRSSAWWIDGKPPYQAIKKEAEQHLTDIVNAALRPNSEAQAGANPRYQSRVNAPVNFVFAPTSTRPNPGGY